MKGILKEIAIFFCLVYISFSNPNAMYTFLSHEFLAFRTIVVTNSFLG